MYMVVLFQLSQAFCCFTISGCVYASSHVEAFRRAEFKHGATDRAASELGRRERASETARLLLCEGKTVADEGTITERLFLKGNRMGVGEKKRGPH